MRPLSGQASARSDRARRASSCSISSTRACTGVSAPRRRQRVVAVARQHAARADARAAQHGDAGRRARRAPPAERACTRAVAGGGDDDALRRRCAQQRVDERGRPRRRGWCTISTRGQRSTSQAATSSRARRRRATRAARAAARPRSEPSGPASPDDERIEAIGVRPCARRRAPCTAPASTATHAARARVRATRTASSRFCGPSGCSAVAGRIAAVSTTGLAGASTRCRK